MLRFFFTDGLHCPLVFCDQCKKRIDDSANGIACFLDPKDPVIVFLHKGECDRKYEAIHGDAFWHELKDTLDQLVFNTTKVKTDDL